MQRILVIGVGGIGSQAMMPLCQYLNYKYPQKFKMVLVDGDKYEDKNASRQIFNDYDNKAIASANLLRQMFKDITINAIDKYIMSSNIKDIIREDDILFIGVDNNNTRALIEKHCLTLNNCVIISGGNDYIDGNVMTFCRKKGVTLGKTMIELHKEIGNGKDKSPHEISCAVLSKSSAPQLVFTNYNIASIMLNELYCILEKGKFRNEVFTDITYNKTRAVNETKFKLKIS